MIKKPPLRSSTTGQPSHPGALLFAGFSPVSWADPAAAETSAFRGGVTC